MERETVYTERYMIREAAKQVGVETHVLRYWEKELALEIPKNEMRHRYYTNAEITLLREIKYLKDQGFHLKSIRLLKDHISEIAQMDMPRLHSLRDRLNSHLMIETTTDEETTDIDSQKTSDSDNNVSNTSNSENSVIFTGSPAGEPVGMPTGKVTGKKVKMVDFTTEKTIMPELVETKKETEREKAQLLELELAEPKAEEEHNTEQKMFDVVQGGRAATDKGFTVFFKNGSLAVTGKETLEKENFISVERKEPEKKDTSKTEETLPEDSEKKELHIAEKKTAQKDNLVGQVGSQEIDNRMEQFRMIMGDIIGQVLRENNKELTRDVSSQVSDKVIKEMDFMLRSQQEEEEERYRKLDETIRSCQRTRQEVAAGKETAKKRKRGLFSGKKGKEPWE